MIFLLNLGDDETNYKGKENGTVKKRKTAITKVKQPSYCATLLFP